MNDQTVPVVVLGASGYVGGELLRLLAGHPRFALTAIASETRTGQPVVEVFPHLRGTHLEEAAFASSSETETAASSLPLLGVFSALPHGDAAKRIDRLLTICEKSGCAARVVDLSADFRHRKAERYEAIYGHPHGAPQRLAKFVCALPELAALTRGNRHADLTRIAHPGCFTTAATLALAPLVAGGWLDLAAPITVTAVTGSTGAGRTPTATTHHPERRSDLFAYSPTGHRHEPEMRALLAEVAGAATGSASENEPNLTFIPHSGPFARGIHATINATLARPASGDEIKLALSSFYGSPASFVKVLDAPPRLQSVVGTNRCDLAVTVRGDQVILFSALDNLTKGAAGGGVQWMNRLFGLPEDLGLRLPGLGWL